MLTLRIVYAILFAASVACLVLGIRMKRRNIGYNLTAGTIALCNVACFFQAGAGNAKEAGNILLPYFILHSWLLFFLLLMIILADRYRLHIWAIIVSACLCVYQTYLVISQYFGARIFSFQKRIYFGKAWWVAIDSKNTGVLFSYRSYRIMTYANMFVLLMILLICIRLTNRVFKARYYAFFGSVIVYSIIEVLTIHYMMPIWFPFIFNNLLLVLALYLVRVYPDAALRGWALDCFTNDMSDGLILYDKNNDLIHLNDMIRTTMSPERIEDFKDKRKLEAWLENAGVLENGTRIVSYEGSDRTRYFRVSVTELGGNNKKLGTLFTLHDTTDSVIRIKAMEEANSELERANRMKSDFLANMSHEIRTPMNAVIGMAEIAMRENDMGRVDQYLHQIQTSGRNLLNIINDILDYSKIESGKMEIIEEDYEPYAEYMDLSNVLGIRIGDKKIELFILIESELPKMLHGDVMRIRQVLINLANNAIKFTPEGKVCIKIKCEPVSEDTINLSVHVIDTGIGIKKEDIDKLFVSFQQLDSKRNRSVEGTGLGLAISQRLVEAMNGKIGVESTYGVGSDFWFTIPQKVVDPTNVLVVENASEKCAYQLNAVPAVSEIFLRETDRLKVKGVITRTVRDYIPSGKKDYLFFTEEKYDGKLKALLKKYPDLNGIVLVGLTSDFVADLPNLHVMHRPESSMAMVNMLNDRFNVSHSVNEHQAYKADFTAPDAKVLIVDDSAINLTVAEGLMAPLNMQLDRATGGQMAIDMAASKDYDIILMDHMMPEVDGVDATKAIREANGNAKYPVIIALSANVVEEARHLFREAGMNDFIGKPVEVKTLITKIKKWLPPEKIVDVTEEEGSGESVAEAKEEVMIRCEGLDIDNAVAALGSTALYDKIVKEYYSSGVDKLKGIQADFANEDWPAYIIKVHSLKSSSRQIGATELGTMAEKLEHAGKDGNIDYIKANNEQAVNAYADLLKKLSLFFPKEEKKDRPPIPEGKLWEIFDALEAACDDLDIGTMEKLGEELKQYSYDADISDLMEQMYKAIAGIDVDRCLELAGKIRGGV